MNTGTHQSPHAAEFTKATGLQTATCVALLAKLDNCRMLSPGLGGDIDAMNLRSMIRDKQWSESAVSQAAGTLGWLSKAVNVDASAELAAVQACYSIASLAAVAHKFREGCERGEAVGEVFFSRLLDEVDAALAQYHAFEVSNPRLAFPSDQAIEALAGLIVSTQTLTERVKQEPDERALHEARMWRAHEAIEAITAVVNARTQAVVNSAPLPAASSATNAARSR